MNFTRRNWNFISYKRSLLLCKVTFKSNLMLFTSVRGNFQDLKKKKKKKVLISEQLFDTVWNIDLCKGVRVFIRIVSIHMYTTMKSSSTTHSLKIQLFPLFFFFFFFFYSYPKREWYWYYPPQLHNSYYIKILFISLLRLTRSYPTDWTLYVHLKRFVSF